jgi:hypothetical protein
MRKQVGIDRWGDQQLVPAEYIAQCHQPSPHNPRCPFSLQFEYNADGHVAGAPHDAFSSEGRAASVCTSSLRSIWFVQDGRQ